MQIYKKITLFSATLYCLLFNSCSTSPILTENVQLNLSEQQKMQREAELSTSHNVRKFNLQNFTYPSEKDLIYETRFKDLDLYSQNLNVLARWIVKDISPKQRIQLNKNCEVLVGRFENKFPLDEQSLACAGWWIEKKNLLAAQENKLKKLPPPVLSTLSKHKKINWLDLQNVGLTQVFPLLDTNNVEKRSFYIKSATHYASRCSLKNANSALILRLENYLPSNEIYGHMEEIYTKMQPCLAPNEEPSEKLHLRMGLLRLLQGKIQLAENALKKTQLEKKPQENSRNLFWLGAIFKKNNPNSPLNPYWSQLIKENPLSLAAIVASQQLNIDPTSTFVKDENIAIQNRVEGGWTKENLEAFVFDILHAKNKSSASAAWVDYVTKTTTTTNPNLILYWALTQNKFRHYFNSIVMLSRYARYQPNFQVSPMILNIQFPQSYLREIVGIKSPVDPVFVLALMRQESAFDENAHSSANARGLMQILPSTAKTIRKSVKADDLFEPQTNIEVGKGYLEHLFKRYNGNPEYVLAAYNAGNMNIDKWLLRVPNANMMLFCDFIPFKETRSYVSIILRNYYWYSRILKKSSDPLAQRAIEQSVQAKYKPGRMQDLISSATNSTLPASQKEALNGIYIFGTPNTLVDVVSASALIKNKN